MLQQSEISQEMKATGAERKPSEDGTPQVQTVDNQDKEIEQLIDQRKGKGAG